MLVSTLISWIQWIKTARIVSKQYILNRNQLIHIKSKVQGLTSLALIEEEPNLTTN